MLYNHSTSFRLLDNSLDGHIWLAAKTELRNSFEAEYRNGNSISFRIEATVAEHLEPIKMTVNIFYLWCAFFLTQCLEREPAREKKRACMSKRSPLYN